MRRSLIATAVTLAVAFLPLPQAGAITYGHVDGDTHPNAGALAADFGTGMRWFCSGALIAPDVFLTAAHCTESLERRGITDAWVTFDAAFDATSGNFIHGSYVAHPGYNPNTLANDVAVVLLDEEADGIVPARLPTLRQLSHMKAAKLKSTWFTNVGYGGTIEFKKHPPLLAYDGVRRYSESLYSGLTKHTLRLLMNNDATGGGGTCFGDSGGPHFLRDTNLLVSTTSWGDAWCRALDQTHRLDIPSVRNFLDDYVALP